MRVFAVRQIHDKQAVGIFLVNDLDDLAFQVDIATEPVFCEYFEIEETGGLIWEDHVTGLSVARDFETTAVPGATADEPNVSVGDKEIADLLANASPIGSFEAIFCNDDVDDAWEILIPGDHIRDPEAFYARHNRSVAAHIEGQAEGREVKRPALPATTNVYFIGCDDHVKIGITNSVEKRMKALSTGHHQELVLLAVIADAPGELEIELHQRFAAHRGRGEWFKLCPEIQAYIDEINGRAKRLAEVSTP